MIMEIAEFREVKQGFNQMFLVSDTYEVLLNDIKKGTDLSSHSHLHKQFVYCFKGEFGLLVNGQNHRVAPGDSLIINSEVVHSADALTDFMSIDVKYISNRKNVDDLQWNVLKETDINEKLVCLEIDLDGIKLKRIRSKVDFAKINVGADQSKKYIVITPEEIKIRVNDTEYKLLPFKIYQIVVLEKLTLHFLSGHVDLILLEI